MNAQHLPFLDLFEGGVQYLVPRWQRRYCWNQGDIGRLIEDLVTVAKPGGPSAHYGGTLLTFPEPAVPGELVMKHRVVDGQQRLTTVSILLASIARHLGPSGKAGAWTRRIICDSYLTNPDMQPSLFRKLRLQDGDEEEYRSGLDGSPKGAGAVTQAWGIIRRIVRKHDPTSTARATRGLSWQRSSR